jgi:hypothetical protein
MPQPPFYPSLLHHLKTDPNALFIDIGVFLGIDLRFLWRDLTSSSNSSTPTALSQKITAIDLIQPFWPLSFTFFADTPTSFPIPFIHADALFPSTSPTLTPLQHKVSVINISQVLHQFSLSGQTSACKTLCTFYSHPPTTGDRNGTVITGNQVGISPPSGRVFRVGAAQTETFQHSLTTWKEMWDVVGKETGTKWETEAELRNWEEVGFGEGEEMGFLGEGAGLLFFTCWRVA